MPDQLEDLGRVVGPGASGLVATAPGFEYEAGFLTMRTWPERYER